MQTPPPESFVVTVARTPADETTIADVIFGSFGIVGVLTLLAIVLGVGFAALLVLWNRRHRPETEHMPSVAPDLTTPASAPPSTPAR